MDDHAEPVHVLFTVFPEYPLGAIVSSWKRFTAREANIKLGRSGAFWQTEYWDRFIRNDAHFRATADYIDNNPVKAGFVSEPQFWPYGSARLKV
jgi:REP element-mobilizing transposase RayT